MFSRDPIVLEFPRILTDRELLRFCEVNEIYHIEREANGLISIQEIAGFESSQLRVALTSGLHTWDKSEKRGSVLLSAGFILPNSAMRGPAVSWISHARMAHTTKEDREGFVHAVPELAIEVPARNSPIEWPRKKMQEYLENGVLLGWLVDIANEAVEIYRPGQEVDVIQGFAGTLSGEDVLPGFEFDLERLK